MEVLIDELMEEEVEELNKIEELKNGPVIKKKENKLADKSLFGKFHDYKSVDLRDIMKVFDDYK